MSYRDRKGVAISAREWAVLIEHPTYRIVAQEMVDEVFVSTVWLGMGNSMFETMTFPGDYQERYATEEQALAGHAEAVAATKRVVLP